MGGWLMWVHDFRNLKTISLFIEVKVILNTCYVQFDDSYGMRVTKVQGSWYILSIAYNMVFYSDPRTNIVSVRCLK